MKASDDYTGYHFISVGRGRAKKEPFSVTVKKATGIPLEKCAWLAFFKTVEKYHGEGYGKKLITDFMDAAKKKTIVVNTSSDYNFGFYGHMGFARVRDLEMLRTKERQYLYVYSADGKTMKKYRREENKIIRNP
jgi:GNAT superfamily N-acetyltransferase